MNAFLSASIFAALAAAQGLAQAQTTNEPSHKPIMQTSCKDYLTMDDVVKPKSIYYTVG
ncbi:MAG: HdeA/HdeB family chaperone [Caldimonas sp.]